MLGLNTVHESRGKSAYKIKTLSNSFKVNYNSTVSRNQARKTCFFALNLDTRSFKEFKQCCPDSCTWADNGGSRLGCAAQRNPSSRHGFGCSFPLAVQLQGVLLSCDRDGLGCAVRPAGKKRAHISLEQLKWAQMQFCLAWHTQTRLYLVSAGKLSHWGSKMTQGTIIIVQDVKKIQKTPVNTCGYR